MSPDEPSPPAPAPAAAPSSPEIASDPDGVSIVELDAFPMRFQAGRELVVAVSRRRTTYAGARRSTALAIVGIRRGAETHWCFRLGEGGIARLISALSRARLELEKHAGNRPGRRPR
jgi:hypothetical protein